MKKFKHLLAFLLVAALMLSLFAACQSDTGSTNTPAANSGNSANNTNNTNDTNNTDTSDTQTPADETVEPDAEVTYDPEDYETVYYQFFDLRDVGGDFGDRIEAAINEYIGPKYGLQVELIFMNVGTTNSTLAISLAGGERYDLLSISMGADFSSMYDEGFLIDATDYLYEYAPNAVEMMQEYLAAFEYDGRLYGIPTQRGYVKDQYILMRKDILDELGLTEKAENMTTLTEYEEIMAAVHDAYTADTGMYAHVKEGPRATVPKGLWNSDNFADVENWDDLLDDTGMVQVVDGDQIAWILDDERYEEKLARVVTWRENGWIWPESNLSDMYGDILIKQGIGFSLFTGAEFGVEASKTASMGVEVVCVKYLDGIVDAQILNNQGLAIPITAEEPEAACRLINALYTDEYLMNLIARGQEGIDYTLNDEGMIEYVEEAHYYQADFLVGNNFLLTPLAGSEPNMFELVKEVNDNAHYSDFIGFYPDTSDLQLYISNMSAVIDQYSATLNTGLYTPEMFAEYKAKLEAAGVHEYLDAYQVQLDAWLANQ